MSIQAVCPKCGRVCTVKDEGAGGKVRCGECKAVFPTAPDTAPAGDPPPPASPPDPQARLIKFVVAIALVGFVAILAVFFGSQYARRVAHEEAIASLSDELEASHAAAAELTAAFEYDDALALFDGFEARVKELDDPALTDRFNRALADVQSTQADYETKLAEGYSVFEGVFISAEEKTAIVDQRERERQAELEEQQRVEDERQRRREVRERARREEADRKVREKRAAVQEDGMTSIQWPQYHADCGKAEFEANEVRSARAFNEQYKGKKVQWSGEVVAITSRGTDVYRITVKMDPNDGRESDVALQVSADLEDVVLELNKGDRIRFVGKIVRQGRGVTDHELDVEDVRAHTDYPFPP